MSGAVRIARIHITVADNQAMRVGLYRSLADVDAALTRAYIAAPAPQGWPTDVLLFSIIWTDGYELRERATLTAEFIAEGMRRGGILRHYLWHNATAHMRSQYPEVRMVGEALIRRLVASIDPPPDDGTRNGWGGPWVGPTLLPDPVAAIARLRDRVAARRPLAAADPSAGTGDARYPVTTHADVRHVVNFVSVALSRDLRGVDPERAGAVWEAWRAMHDAIATLLRLGDDAAPYADNEGLWLRQLPHLAHLAHLLTRPEPSPAAPRNAALAFQPVGSAGEPYPAWLQAARGHSGVYLIREHQADGTAPIVYVGSSNKDRLYETVTRHFQAWRRGKGFWEGQYTENHDPGLTYDRATVTVALVITAPDDARPLEYDTIHDLSPRDNLLGQRSIDDAVDDGWLDDDAPAATASDHVAVPF